MPGKNEIPENLNEFELPFPEKKNEDITTKKNISERPENSSDENTDARNKVWLQNRINEANNENGVDVDELGKVGEGSLQLIKKPV